MSDYTTKRNESCERPVAGYRGAESIADSTNSITADSIFAYSSEVVNPIVILGTSKESPQCSPSKAVHPATVVECKVKKDDDEDEDDDYEDDEDDDIEDDDDYDDDDDEDDDDEDDEDDDYEDDEDDDEDDDDDDDDIEDEEDEDDEE